MKKNRTVIVLTTLFGTIALLVIVGVIWLSSWLCDDEIYTEYLSPSGVHTVRQVIRNCGATTDYVTTLKLGPFNEIISIKGAHETDLSLKWVDDQNAIVNFMGDTNRIYAYRTNVSGVHIEYKSGVKTLEIKCLYYECERQSRDLEIQRRKQWCSFNASNRATCDGNPGWETCEEGGLCQYSGPNI